MRVKRCLALFTLALAVLAWPLGRPASAGVSAGTVGPTVQVHMTGDETLTVTCSGGKVMVNGSVPNPALACGSFQTLGVTADGGAQRVDLRQLGNAAFTSDPAGVLVMGSGSDTVVDGPNADSIDTGGENDTLTLVPGGAANTAVTMGTGSDDRLTISATAGSETISLASTGADVAVTIVGPTPMNATVAAVDDIYVNGAGGNDTIDATGITGTSTIDTRLLDGGAGSDTIDGTVSDDTLFGGAGTNTLRAYGGEDSIWSASSTDTIDPGADAVADTIYDEDSPRSGGRTITNLGPEDHLHIQATSSDVVSRIRPNGPAGQQQWTVSLDRSGQYTLGPDDVGTLVPSHFSAGQPDHRSIVDAVLGPRSISAGGGNGRLGLLDVTVPTGGWEVFPNGDGSNVTVIPDDLGLGQVTHSQTHSYRVHGPWTDLNQGWAHRVTRDLMFRFASDPARDQIRDQLTDGSRTRVQVTASLMNTDEYRGLDVDRTFLDYLRRKSDPSGRSYWIGSLRNGKSLRQFRAQLFGSNEYFTKSGGTNAAYMVRAYADIMGRAPDPGGQTYWTNKLNNGTERGLVARQFLASTEARRTIVREQFRRFIDRLPTDTEAATWVSRLGTSSTGEQELIAFLANSSAYYNRT